MEIIKLLFALLSGFFIAYITVEFAEMRILTKFHPILRVLWFVLCFTILILIVW